LPNIPKSRPLPRGATEALGVGQPVPNYY